MLPRTGEYGINGSGRMPRRFGAGCSLKTEETDAKASAGVVFGFRDLTTDVCQFKMIRCKSAGSTWYFGTG